MGTSTHYRDGDEPGIRDRAPSLAIGHHEPEHGDHDLARILRDIRDTLASARADIAELLRRAAPPNDHP
jgi:hypothetical protein